MLLWLELHFHNYFKMYRQKVKHDNKEECVGYIILTQKITKDTRVVR